MDKNESAFPITSNVYPERLGMTLRDYFAAKAMQAILSLKEQNLTPNDIYSLAIASFSYHQADAMLAKREKSKESDGRSK